MTPYIDALMPKEITGLDLVLGPSDAVAQTRFQESVLKFSGAGTSASTDDSLDGSETSSSSSSLTATPLADLKRKSSQAPPSNRGTSLSGSGPSLRSDNIRELPSSLSQPIVGNLPRSNAERPGAVNNDGAPTGDLSSTQSALFHFSRR